MSNLHRTNQPAISICLPVYNGEKFLRQAIECVLAQSFGNFELLISDDCSVDATRQILEECALSDKRVKYWRNERRLGLFANYNRCMERTSAPVIKLFAQDDLWDQHILEKQYKLLEQSKGVVLVAARRDVIDHEGNRAKDCFQPVGLVDILGDKQIYRGRDVIRACLDPLINLIGEPSTVMFRSISRGAGFHTTFKHLGDLEYWLRILSDGDFGLVNECLAYFRSHEHSATANNVRQLWGFVDILHMADAASGVLGQMSISKDEFIKSNLAIVTNYLGDLIAAKEIGPSWIREDDDYSKLDVASLKKALFYALDLIAESEEQHRRALAVTAPGHAGRLVRLLQNEVLIKNAEKILRGLLNTVSWHATRPFRELNKLSCAGGGVTSQWMDRRRFTSESPLRQQQSYLRYLKSERIRVLKSRSWRFTRIFRKGLHTSTKSALKDRNLSTEAPLRNGSIAPRQDTMAIHSRGPTQERNHQPSPRQDAPGLEQNDDLPPRIPKAGTFNVNQLYEYDLALGAIVKDEVRFLPEWIEYHLNLGVQKFFIFDNLSEDNPKSALRPYVKEGLVEIYDWPMTHSDQPGFVRMQMGAYRRIVDMCADDVKWLGFIDIDEFIVPLEEDNLVDVLADYEDVGGVSLNWIMFGTSGIKQIPDDKLVIESLTRRAQTDEPTNHYVKTISRAERIRRCKDPHAMIYDIGFKQVNTKKMPMYSSMSSSLIDYRLRINHYWTGDENYFWQRRVKAAKECNDLIALDELNRRSRDYNAVEDTAIQRFVPQVKARLAARKTSFCAATSPAAGRINS